LNKDGGGYNSGQQCIEFHMILGEQRRNIYAGQSIRNCPIHVDQVLVNEYIHSIPIGKYDFWSRVRQL
jgi:hypothetical protein